MPKSIFQNDTAAEIQAIIQDALSPEELALLKTSCTIARTKKLRQGLNKKEANRPT